MMNNNNLHNATELSDDQRRLIIDAEQAFAVWRATREDLRHRYAGSMRWVTRRGHEYLHRKVGDRERSLGPRSPETEAAQTSFETGRASAQERLATLDERLATLAPVHRAWRLGRVPRLPARILRRLDENGLLGTQLLVAGTHALFAYEAAAGVHLPPGLLATGDADLLWDARKQLALVQPEAREAGLLGLLQRVDRTFAVRSPRDFRASNASGFFVDLIRPQDRTFFAFSARDTLGHNPDDLHGAALTGLNWLLNVPRLEAVAIGEDGLPVRLVTYDPRAYALHKLWLARREDRSPIKAPRDESQARAVAVLATRWLGLKFDDEVLRGLPLALRRLAGELVG